MNICLTPFGKAPHAHNIWRRRLITATVALCLSVVLIEGNVTLRQLRSQTQTPAIMMLAAIPQKRVKRAGSATVLGVDTVSPNVVVQESAGFTLIELSIVLVVIGLVVGGVLVGRDLISAAAVRAQISQIERYQTAVNTFKGKFNALPGDISDPDATNFGFAARGTLQGEGDNNGMIEGIITDASPYPIGMVPSGETLMFWVDLSTIHVIENSFSVAVSATSPTAITNPVSLTSTPNKVKDFWPEAKIGNNNYVNVYSDSGVNYFNLAIPRGIGQHSSGGLVGLTVAQAYAIDQKMDDGYPASGKVVAQYQNGFVCGANNGPCNGTLFSNPVTNTPALSTSCFDNGNVFNVKMQYSMTQNNGTGINCALSFKFQ